MVCVGENMRKLSFADAYLSKTHGSRSLSCFDVQPATQLANFLTGDYSLPSSAHSSLFFLNNMNLSTTNSDWPLVPLTTTTKNIMPTLLSLPTELLCQIADSVDTTDLVHLRLVCKPLRDAANKPFGITHVKHRRHVLTQRSIEALLEIVTHPTLGAYVDSIAMIPLVIPAEFLSTDPPFSPETQSKLPVDSRSYMKLMKQVFANILGHQNSVHISICSLGTMSDHDPPDVVEWLETVIHYPTETLEDTLIAAIRANCSVRSLELNMHQHKFNDLHDALEDLLSPTRPPLKLIIHCSRKRTRVFRHPYTITFDQADHSLKLDGCDLDELVMAKVGSSIKRLFGFLFAQITQLVLENCYLCSARHFAIFLALDGSGAFARTLTSVRLQNFRPCRSAPEVARRHWSGILSALSNLGGLKYFVIAGLHSPTYWDLFHLPRTTEKHELSGVKVAAQLEIMAVLVATEPVKEVPALNN